MKTEVIFLMVHVVNVLGQRGAFREASGNHWKKRCLEREVRQTSQRLRALPLCLLGKVVRSVIWFSSEVSLPHSPFTPSSLEDTC